MTARVLMLQGASSSVGKSLLVAALCRIWARRGVRVAPFKAQNMSNNAAVCADGSEIGRAQAVQAFASGVEPTADMNPLLLKPEADACSQVILLGRHWQTLSAGTFYRHKADLWPEVSAALDRLRSQYELVVIEGAGSAAELNLKAGDLVNMAVARYADAPVVLVGDIDRGGIFAQLLGTLWLLEPEEQNLVRGFLVNKFRGDLDLFTDGVRMLEERGGVPVLGLIPYVHDLGIPEEDAVAIESLRATSVDAPTPREVDIVVVALPRISNFDDFDPLAAEPGVQVRYVSSVGAIGRPQAIILPGTKSTIADLTWLHDRGLDVAVKRFAKEGGAVVGICGGFQMLGEVVRDPDHTESSLDSVPGLGLLPVQTIFEKEKATYRAEAKVLGGPGWLKGLAGETVLGYEIHMGRTQVDRPWLEITGRGDRPVSVPDGAMSEDGRVWGCYIHGLFENSALRRAWLGDLGWGGTGDTDGEGDLSVALDRLADIVEMAVNISLLESVIDAEPN